MSYCSRQFLSSFITGLFHRAILLSGSALSSWALVEEPVVYSLEIARQLNCTSGAENFQNQEHIIDCLREIPIAELMKTKVVAPTFLNAFGPSVDGVVIKSNFQDEMLASMLPEWQTYSKSTTLYNNGVNGNAKVVRDSKLPINANKYDLLFGCVTSEALWRYKLIFFYIVYSNTYVFYAMDHLAKVAKKVYRR